jgi:hypothetical protein
VRRTARAAVAGLIVASAVAATWPLARHLDQALPGDLGDPLLNAWILGWDADRLRHGLRGLWEAPNFYPYHHTLAFSEHLLGIAIPLAPVDWLTSPIVAYNVAFIASFVLAAAGMYLLTHALTGRRDAACLAGLVFAFAPMRFGQVGHLQVLMAGWMPIALWGLHDYFRTARRRGLVVFTAAFLAEGLSNGYYLYFLALPSAILAAAGFATLPDRRRTIARDLLACAAVIVVVMLPIAREYYGARQAYGFLRTEQEPMQFGADLGAYLAGNDALSPPLRLWRALPRYAKPPGPEGQLFPGLIAIGLALAALWPGATRPRRRAVWLYAAIGMPALWLSMGTAPTVWGHAVPIGGVYRWLFAHLPGFDGLRVPARLAIVVLLALAVLAAFGFARLSRRWPAALRAAAVATAAVVLWLEGTGGAMPLALLGNRGRPDHAAYLWVRDHERGAVLELPAGALDTKWLTYQYQYQTLVHHHRLVNGASGYDSALQVFLGTAPPIFEPDYVDDGVWMLRAIGVRTVIVHPDAFPDPAGGRELVARLRAARGQVVSEAPFPGLVVFRLADIGAEERPPHETAGVAPPRLDRPVPSAAFAVRANRSADRLPFAFDGDLDSRWLTGQPQSGDEWIALTFDRPRDITRVRLLTSLRSVGDYPRGLIVEGADNGASFRELARGSVVTALARGLVRDPEHGPIDVWLPPNHTTRLRIRQTGHTPRWFWSVDELQVREARP